MTPFRRNHRVHAVADVRSPIQQKHVGRVEVFLTCYRMFHDLPDELLAQRRSGPETGSNRMTDYGL